MNKELIIGIVTSALGSGVITTLITLLLNKRKTAAEAAKIEVEAKKTTTENDLSVLNAQHSLLEKLLERSQKLVEEHEKLQKDYGVMLVENATLRAELVSRDMVIANLQKDTKSMRIEIKAIMERVTEIDKHLALLNDTANSAIGGNSNPFPKES